MFFEILNQSESYDDDLYDGAAEITKRGRIEVLEMMFQSESHEESKRDAG